MGKNAAEEDDVDADASAVEAEERDSSSPDLPARASGDRGGADDPSSSTTALNDGTEGDDDENDGDGWVELMGPDIRMKVLGTGSDEPTPRAAAPFVDDGDDDDVGPEAKDAALITFVGRAVLPSASSSPSKVEDEVAELRRGPIFHESSSEAPIWIVIGQGDVCNGLEMCVRFLKVRQTAVVRISSRFAYGSGGRKLSVDGDALSSSSKKSGGDDDGGERYEDLPPDADVCYRVTLHAVVPCTSSTFDEPSFRIERSLSKKTLGNDVYIAEWEGPKGGFAKGKALKLYKAGGDEMESLVNELRSKRLEEKDEKEGEDGKDDDEAGGATTTAEDRETNEKEEDETNRRTEELAFSILIDCLNNASAVLMRSKEYKAAKESSAEVLRVDPNNVKALCRAARAAMLDPSGTYEESLAALEVAEELVGKDDAEVKRIRADFERRRKAYRKREKDMYGKMLGNKGKDGSASPSGATSEESSKGESGETKEGGAPEKGDDDDVRTLLKRSVIHFVSMVLSALMLVTFLKWTGWWEEDRNVKDASETKFPAVREEDPYPDREF